MQVKIPIEEEVTSVMEQEVQEAAVPKRLSIIERDEQDKRAREPVIKEEANEELRRSQRERRAPIRYEASWAAIEEPRTFIEAMTGPDCAKWERAVKEELLAHEENET